MSVCMAHVSCTIVDERAGYPETRAYLAKATDSELIREYHECVKDSFGMFAGNAKRFGNLVVEELLRRGKTKIANIFGDIAIEPFRF